MTQFLSKNNAASVAAVLTVVIVAAAAIVNHVALKNQLEKWRMLPEPERLTELYLTNSRNIPGSYTPGVSLPADFTVHNLEGRATTYNYTIAEQADNGTASYVLAKGSFSLNQNQTKAVRAAVTPLDMGERAKVTIRLTDDIAVDYWIKKGV